MKVFWAALLGLSVIFSAPVWAKGEEEGRATDCRHELELISKPWSHELVYFSVRPELKQEAWHVFRKLKHLSSTDKGSRTYKGLMSRWLVGPEQIPKIFRERPADYSVLMTALGHAVPQTGGLRLLQPRMGRRELVEWLSQPLRIQSLREKGIGTVGDLMRLPTLRQAELLGGLRGPEREALQDFARATGYPTTEPVWVYPGEPCPVPALSRTKMGKTCRKLYDLMVEADTDPQAAARSSE